MSCHIQPMPMASQPKPERHAPPRSAAPAPGVRPEGDLEQGDADEGQRPPSPRRQRQGDEEPAAERERAATGPSRATPRRWRSCRQVEVDDDALADRARRMAGEQRGRSGRGSGRRSRRASGSTISVRTHVVHVTRPTAVDMITSSPGASSSRLRKSCVVADPVAGDDDVADLAGHRRARPVPRAAVQRRQADALEHRAASARSRGSRSSRARCVGSCEPSSAGGGDRARATAAGSWPATVVGGARRRGDRASSCRGGQRRGRGGRRRSTAGRRRWSSRPASACRRRVGGARRWPRGPPRPRSPIGASRRSLPSPAPTSPRGAQA